MDEWTKKDVLIWTSLLAGTGLLMFLILITGETSLDYTMVLFLIVVKFIAGLGTVIGIISFIIFMLTKFASKYCGEENRKNLKLLMTMGVLIIIGLLIYQGPVKIIQSILSTGGDVDTFFDKVLFIYGIVSLMFTMYVLPFIKVDVLTITNITTKDIIKNNLSKTGQSVKKWFYERKKDYGKAELITELSLKQDLRVLRQRFAVILLLPLGVGTLLFMPICAALVLTWLRIFVFTSRKLFRFERYIAACACIVISVISAIMPFVLDLTPLYTVIQGAFIFTYISQFCGLLIAALFYLVKLLKPIRQKQVAKQLKTVKEEKEALERERKRLLKERKQLVKQVDKSKKPEPSNKKPEPSNKKPEPSNKKEKSPPAPPVPPVPAVPKKKGKGSKQPPPSEPDTGTSTTSDFF